MQTRQCDERKEFIYQTLTSFAMRWIRYIPVFTVMVVVTLLEATPAVLQLRILWLKHRAAKRLEQACLKTIYLSNKEIRWEEAGKELRIGERLFDVESYHQTKQGLVVAGLFDDEETSIEAKANAFWEKEAPQQAGFLVKYFQLLNGICLTQNTWRFCALPFGENNYPDTLLCSIKPVYLSIPSPPPQEAHFFIWN